MSRSRAGALLAGGLLAGLALSTAAAPPAIAQDFRAIAVDAQPITRFRIGSDETRFGELEFLGGLVLSSADRAFGSLSGIDVLPDGSFLAVADTGFWLKARLRETDGRPLALEDVAIAPILAEDGRPARRKSDTDAEAVRLEPDGLVLVAFERNLRIARYPLAAIPAGPADRIPLPAMPDVGGNRGIEAVAVAAPDGPLQGSPVVISERSLDAAGNSLAWVLEGPGKGQFSIRRIDDFDVSDATFLPGGDLLLLERRFSLSAGLGMRLRRIPADSIAPGATVDGPVLLTADRNYDIDNMEGLAARPLADGGALVTVVADDNNNLLERTVLLQFAWHPARTEAAAVPPGSGSGG